MTLRWSLRDHYYVARLPMMNEIAYLDRVVWSDQVPEEAFLLVNSNDPTSHQSFSVALPLAREGDSHSLGLFPRHLLAYGSTEISLAPSANHLDGSPDDRVPKGVLEMYIGPSSIAYPNPALVRVGDRTIYLRDGHAELLKREDPADLDPTIF